MKPRALRTQAERQGLDWLRGAAAVVAAVALLFACTEPEPSLTERLMAYDDAHHRAELEGQLGRPVDDWPTYVATIREVCALPDDDEFELNVSMYRDEGAPLYPAFRLSITHLCPERMPQVALVERGESH